MNFKPLSERKEFIAKIGPGLLSAFVSWWLNSNLLFLYRCKAGRINCKYSLRHIYHDRRDVYPPVYELSLVRRASRLSYLLKDCFRISFLTDNVVH